MIPKLPIWARPNTLPAANDHESATVLEQTYKLYQKMSDLVNDYNKFVEDTNIKYAEFVAKYNEDIENFTLAFRQEYQDFIDTVDLRISGFENTIIQTLEEYKTATTTHLESLIGSEVNRAVSEAVAVITEGEF